MASRRNHWRMNPGCAGCSLAALTSENSPSMPRCCGLSRLALCAITSCVDRSWETGFWLRAATALRQSPVACRQQKSKPACLSLPPCFLGLPASFVACTCVFEGFAGILSALRISSAAPIAGTGYELEVIAMVVVGGTALTGGLGTIIGTVIGVMLLRIIRNGIIMAGVPGLAYNIFVGVIILAMLIINSRLEKHIKLR